LDDLDRGKPEPVGVAHIFALTATLVADTGDRLGLCSDNIYSLYPRFHGPELVLSALESEHRALELEKWLCQTPAQLIQYLTNWSIKVYNETLAFHIAAHHNALPEGLKPNHVSPLCYCGDLNSPLRQAWTARRAAPLSEEGITANEFRMTSGYPVMDLPASPVPRSKFVRFLASFLTRLRLDWTARRAAPMFEEGVIANEFRMTSGYPVMDLPASPVPRSNLVQFLASTLTRWPEFGSQIWEALCFLEATDDEVLKSKFAYVREQLTTLALHLKGGTPPQNIGVQLTASSVRCAPASGSS
jgi:hypothetical protein